MLDARLRHLCVSRVNCPDEIRFQQNRSKLSQSSHKSPTAIAAQFLTQWLALRLYRELTKTIDLFAGQFQVHARLFISDPTQFTCSDPVSKFFLPLTPGSTSCQPHFMPHHLLFCRLQPLFPSHTNKLINTKKQ